MVRGLESFRITIIVIIIATIIIAIIVITISIIIITSHQKHRYFG